MASRISLEIETAVDTLERHKAQLVLKKQHLESEIKRHSWAIAELQPKNFQSKDGLEDGLEFSSRNYNRQSSFILNKSSKMQGMERSKRSRNTESTLI